jgi:hypothetical protein
MLPPGKNLGTVFPDILFRRARHFRFVSIVCCKKPLAGEQLAMGHESRVSHSVRAVVEAQGGELLHLRQALKEMLGVAS